MVQLVLTEQADFDLALIITYLAHEAGTATAERYAREFDSLFDRLIDFPRLGLTGPRDDGQPNPRAISYQERRPSPPLQHSAVTFVRQTKSATPERRLGADAGRWRTT